MLAGSALALLPMLALGLVVTPPAAAASRPTVVLDPDDNDAHGEWGGVTYHGYDTALAIAHDVQASLPATCAADIAITDRHSSATSAGRAARAAQMQSADLSVTLSMNGLTGTPWGTAADGGSEAFTTNRSDNLAFGTDLLNQMHAYTSRPGKPVNEGPTNGTAYPYPEFSSLSGTYAQVFLLYMDHNYDFPVIQKRRDLIVRAVVAALGHALQTQGFKCLGAFPALPTAAELQRLRNLGYQNYLRYGAEPVSMSTGNFSTAERTFTLPGVGNQQIDLTLNYNAQSGQDSPVGTGWQFAYGAFLQQYSDGSVAVNLADGHVLLYPPDGSGGFSTPPGAFATLTPLDASTFKWTTTTGTSLTFVQDASGRGMLTATSDRQGNIETLSYSGSGTLFPRLSGITDQASQHVAVTTNSDGRITSFTRPDGALWQLAYSAAGDLTSLTSARGTVRHFGYDGQHRMTGEVGQDGVTFLTNTYDSQSRVIEQTNAFDQVRTLVYDDANRTTTYTDTTGAVTVYRWNALGEVTEVDDALGGVAKTDYNSQLLPASDTDPLNHTTSTTYDASGQPSSVADPLGNAVQSTHNSSGDLTSKTDSGGSGGSARTTNFTLNSAGLPIVITNPDSTTQSRSYNANGDVVSSTDENGAVTSYGYDARGNTTTVADPLGRVTTMTYDLANRLTSVKDSLGRTTSYQYDPNDNLTKIAYPNGASEFRTYDVNDQLASSTDRRGATTEYVYDAELNTTAIKLPNGGVIKHTFDREDRLTSTTDAEGHKTIYTLDALGRRTATTDANGHAVTTGYNAAGQVVSETDPSGATTKFASDANGRVITVTDPAGGVIANQWDLVGRQTRVTDQLGRATKRTYNFRDQVTSTTDPAGKVSTNSYDPAGRLIKQTDAAGAVTTFTYDSAGQLIKVTDPLGGVTTHKYDLAGNRISTTDPNGHTSKISYNAMNEPVGRTNALGSTWTMTRDPGGLITDEADPLGHHTSHVFDAIGNQTATTDALGRATTFGYDLNQRRISVTAPDGVATANQYDPVGNLVSVVRNQRGGQSASATVNVTTRYFYDSRDLLISTTDANSAVTGQAYNNRGLLTRVTNPLGKVTSYGYNAVGNRTSRTDANGKTTDYAFDQRDLMVRRTYADGSQETFGYDAVGRQLTANNGAGTVTTAYDLLGRTTKVTDAAGKALSYRYDPVSNRTGLTLPDGRTLAYTYDAADQLTKLASPLGVVNLAYDAAGRRTTVQRPNGTQTAAAYNNADELTQLLTTAGSTTLASFVYSYDAASNVASRFQNLGGSSTTTNYSYDPLRRLTASSGGPLPSTYTYDAAGNRLTWSAPDDPLTPKPDDPFVQTNKFNAAGQVVTSTKARQNGNKTFTDVTTNSYDANGNRVLSETTAQAPGQSAGTGYDYDFENRLVATGPAGDRDKRGNGAGQRDYTRTYDALGRLVTETRGKTSTTWTADGLNLIVATDASTTFYLRDAGGALQGEQTNTSDPNWYVADALGSILGATTAKAKVSNVTTYSDYGVNLASSDFRMGFGGELADPFKPGNGVGNDTPRLNQYYARSYEPGTGTWLQPDPLRGTASQPETLSPYQYVRDNPSSKKDLLGYLDVILSSSYPGTLSVVQPTGYSGSLSVAPPPTFTGNLSVGISSGSWNGSLQGYSGSAQLLQPGATNAASLLQPTISGSQLQPAAGWDALTSSCKRKQLSCRLTVSGAAPHASNGGASAGAGTSCKDYFSDDLYMDYLYGAELPPCGFLKDYYTPSRFDWNYGTRAADPGGDCTGIQSTPTGRSFLDICRTHDYAYDLLRYRHMQPDYNDSDAGSLRRQADALFQSDLHSFCNGGWHCLYSAWGTYRVVKGGTWFAEFGDATPGGPINPPGSGGTGW